MGQSKMPDEWREAAQVGPKVKKFAQEVWATAGGAAESGPGPAGGRWTQGWAHPNAPCPYPTRPRHDADYIRCAQCSRVRPAPRSQRLHALLREARLEQAGQEAHPCVARAQLPGPPDPARSRRRRRGRPRSLSGSTASNSLDKRRNPPSASGSSAASSSDAWNISKARVTIPRRSRRAGTRGTEPALQAEERDRSVGRDDTGGGNLHRPTAGRPPGEHAPSALQLPTARGPPGAGAKPSPGP